MAHVDPDAAAADTQQLKYKGVNEIKADVTILKVIFAVVPLPEYVAVALKNCIPCDLFVPLADTKAQ